MSLAQAGSLQYGRAGEFEPSIHGNLLLNLSRLIQSDSERYRIAIAYGNSAGRPSHHLFGRCFFLESAILCATFADTTSSALRTGGLALSSIPVKTAWSWAAFLVPAATLMEGVPWPLSRGVSGRAHRLWQVE